MSDEDFDDDTDVDDPVECDDGDTDDEKERLLEKTPITKHNENHADVSKKRGVSSTSEDAAPSKRFAIGDSQDDLFNTSMEGSAMAMLSNIKPRTVHESKVSPSKSSLKSNRASAHGFSNDSTCNSRDLSLSKKSNRQSVGVDSEMGGISSVVAQVLQKNALIRESKGCPMPSRNVFDFDMVIRDKDPGGRISWALQSAQEPSSSNVSLKTDRKQVANSSNLNVYPPHSRRIESAKDDGSIHSVDKIEEKVICERLDKNSDESNSSKNKLSSHFRDKLDIVKPIADSCNDKSHSDVLLNSGNYDVDTQMQNSSDDQPMQEIVLQSNSSSLSKEDVNDPGDTGLSSNKIRNADNMIPDISSSIYESNVTSKYEANTLESHESDDDCTIISSHIVSKKNPVSIKNEIESHSDVNEIYADSSKKDDRKSCKRFSPQPGKFSKKTKITESDLAEHNFRTGSVIEEILM